MGAAPSQVAVLAPSAWAWERPSLVAVEPSHLALLAAPFGPPALVGADSKSEVLEVALAEEFRSYARTLVALVRTLYRGLLLFAVDALRDLRTYLNVGGPPGQHSRHLDNGRSPLW